MNRECSDDCAVCPLAEPQLCRQFAVMTQADHTVRWCKHCDEMARYQQTPWPDGYGHTIMVDEWYCPNCRRVFG